MKIQTRVIRGVGAQLKQVLFTALFFIASNAQAQDIVTFTDGKTVEAKVLEITHDEIKYKKFNNETGPLRVVRLNEVHMIQYQNGDIEEYAALKAVPKEDIEKIMEWPKRERKDLLSENGFFIDGFFGACNFERTIAEGETVHGAIGFGNSAAPITGRYAEVIPTIGVRFGSKFYFGDRSKKYIHGLELDWFSTQINLQRYAGIHLAILSPGYSGILKFNENTGLEFNLVVGFNMIARDIGSNSFGYFRTPQFNPIYGYSIAPGVKFRSNGFAVGLDYSYAGTFKVQNDPTYNTLRLSIGRKF